MSLDKIARNRHGDEVLALFGDMAHRVTSDPWSVHALQSSYESLVAGDKENGSLITYSLLKPSIVEQFGSTIIASACFEDTMLSQLWKGQGVEMKPITGGIRNHLRYERHQNGDRIIIAYVGDEDWSKTQRDRKVEVDGSTVQVKQRLVGLIGDVMGDQPFAWMGNKDLPDDLFGHLPGAERLPNSPYGLNSFQHLHQVVVLSALNPPPTHFAFMETRGVNGEEVRTAHYRTAVYQAVMRISIRNPACDESKLVVVMDRATAYWLADLFPGAKVEALEGLGVALAKGKPGRPRVHQTSAERKRAYRERQKEAFYADLMAINGPGLEALSYRDFITKAMSQDEVVAESWDKNTLIKDIPSRTSGSSCLSMGTAFGSQYATAPLLHLDVEDDEDFIRLLGDLHQQKTTSKEDNVLLSPAHFDPDKPGTEKYRGLANITHVRGIWMDNDGGDLTHHEFARLFPSLRVVVWNTHSSTPAKPRWRAFIPTTYAMSVEVHRCIMKQIVQALRTAGYLSQKDLAKGTAKKAYLCHGFDTSKFNAASLFYGPCQAAHPNGSFFHDYQGGKRGPLDLCMWLDHCILDLRPEPELLPVPAAEPITSEPLPLEPQGKSAALLALSNALRAQKTQVQAKSQDAMVAKAEEDWRMTPKGHGHNGFFKLACALQRAGLEEWEIRAKLNENAGSGRSSSDRRKEVSGIMRSLKKVGRIG